MGFRNSLPKKVRCSGCGEFRRAKWEVIEPGLAVGWSTCQTCDKVHYHTTGQKAKTEAAAALLQTLMKEKPLNIEAFDIGGKPDH